jgi:predicted helicase
MVEHMIDNRLHYSRKGIPLLCPLYLYDETGTKTSNVNSELIPNFEDAVSMKCVESKSDESTQFDVLDLADYCYAILFSNSYRAAYKEFLCIEFPRVPIPTSKEFFLEMVCKGRELREIHTMHTSLENNLNIEFVGIGSNEITNISYANERIKINSTQSFTNVREDLWDFCFGGYHGLQKWFKDRKHSSLSESDIKHVISVLNIFDETQKLMVEIDDIFSRFEINLGL